MRLHLPPTERPHPLSRSLEALPMRDALARLHAGDAEAVRAVGRAIPALARVAAAAADAIAGGGRLVYAGAGTSGRLAALDAAECPPTFGTRPEQVIALVAGGERSLVRAVEGAEDDRAAARASVRRARVGPRDLVVGVSASGVTPWVVAALAEARARRARTALLTSNPSAGGAGLRVVLRTGPELVAGSTRMKAGTATKMALTLISTGAMLRLGRVRSGLMIDLTATSVKLRRRAVRIVSELTGSSAPVARAALARSAWRIREAVRVLSAEPGGGVRR